MLLPLPVYSEPSLFYIHAFLTSYDSAYKKHKKDILC